MDRGLIRRGPFPPSPPPPNPEKDRKQEELEQLFSRLMGREIRLPDVQALLAAVVDSNKPFNFNNVGEYLDRLLARLRELVREECQFTDCMSLTAAVREKYWIR